MFFAFIFAVLLLKYCFSTGDQLQRYCTSDIFYSSQAVYNCCTYYLMAWLNKADDTRQHDVTAGMHYDSIEQNSFYIHKMTIQINELILHASPA